MIHADPGIFVSLCVCVCVCVGGGGGGSRSIWHIKKALTTFFFILFFFVLNLFYRSPVVDFKENYYLLRFQWGWNIFQGRGSNFLQAGPIAFSL